MTKQSKPEIDWNLGTWKGSRRKQHAEFHAIPFSRKMEIIEEMNESIRELRQAQLREKGSGVGAIRASASPGNS